MTLRRGMSGDIVEKLQTRLKELRALVGRADGDFGGGTESAVKTFQRSAGLTPSGAVDPATWGKLFPGEPVPENPLASAPALTRCMALTGSFETGKLPPDCFCGVTGDFDGQGVSFGVLQWNIGQGSLQPLLGEAFERHPAVCQNIFHEHFDTLRALGEAPLDQQLDFTRTIQTRNVVDEPWRGMLKTLGRTPEFQQIQTEHATKVFETARGLCSEYKLRSQRAAALMFDIVTQNGSIGPVVKAQIMADYATIAAGNADDVEVARMRAVAIRRASAARPEFVNDVRTRKLAIAEGTGTVHGIFYDLADSFAITLQPFQ